VIRYVLRRLGLLIPTLFGVITLVFAMIALSPGDPARVMLGERANKESIEKLRKELGLDKPLIQQYGAYLKRVAVLDLGHSIKTGQNVIDEIRLVSLLPSSCPSVPCFSPQCWGFSSAWHRPPGRTAG
jgi:ABC-type dipeptide/oligopeptide/nickel transport system permease component